MAASRGETLSEGKSGAEGKSGECRPDYGPAPLAITFAASVASVSGVSLLYPALPVIARDLHVATSSIGMVIAAYTLPAIVLAPLFGVIADMKGRRWLLVVGLTIFAAAGAAATLASSFSVLLALRAIQGVGFSMFTPLTIVLISDLLPPERELGAQGQKVVIDRVAMITLPLAGGALAALSWRSVFAPFVLVLALGWAAWRWMPETKAPGKVDGKKYFADTRTALRLPRIRIGLLAGFLRFFLDYGMFIYVPLMLALRIDASASMIGFVLAASAVGAIVTAASVGGIAKRGTPERVLALAFLACGGGLLLMGAHVALWSATVASFAFGLGNGLISPLQKSLLTRNAPPALRGGVISVDRVIQQVAKSLSPAMIGLALLIVPLEAVFIALGVTSVGGATLLACSEFNMQKRSQG